MNNKNKGQIRIGKQGPIIATGNQDYSSKIKSWKEKEKKRKEYEKSEDKHKKRKNFEKSEDNVEESSIIIKFSNRIHGFNALVIDNQTSGRPWYYGLEGDWWWGMTEDEARIKIKSEEDILDSIDTIEDIIEEIDIKDIKDLDNIPAQDVQIRTVSDMIDWMMSEYDNDLPKDPKNRISYIYPLESTHSFHIVAVNHIKYLRDEHSSNEKLADEYSKKLTDEYSSNDKLEDKYSNNEKLEIEEIDWSSLSNIDWQEKRNVLIHPFMYPFASKESFIQNSKNFAKLLATKNKIGGFDVADSDKISTPAVDLINKIDLMIVPSNFARDAYINSGVTIPIEVLPHGVSDEFLSNDIVDTDNKKLLKLRKLKTKGKILVLFFLIHSGHRKGADLVRKVMKRIQKKFKDVYLVVKSEDYSYFSDIKSFHINSWLNDRDLVALYDTCDICLSPSRGGGFELNALEAVSRGLPTLVPNGGCFLDLINYFIPVNVSDKITQPLPGNPIHIGLGHEVDIDDFEIKITDTINRLDFWKSHFKGNIGEIREKYSWKNTAKILDEHLKNHGFID